MHDRCDITIVVPPLREDFCHTLQVGDRIQIRRGLLAAKTTVEIAAYRGMLAIPGKLANVIDVVGNVGEHDALIVFRSTRPARTQHPVIERHADHSAARKDGVDLFVIKLALVWN